MFKRIPTILAALATIITLASCSQKQSSVDNKEDTLQPPVEILDFKAPLKRPHYLEQPTKSPVEDELVLEPLPEDPAKPDTVILTIGRHEFTVDKFPFKAEFEGGIGHTICYQERGDNPRWACN